MKTYIAFWTLLLAITCSSTAFAIPAFPGAAGMGANSVGGRGGTVIKVTNLNDSGSGSFRAAVTASGPRIVVFEVSGYINLNSMIEIQNPYITIAGQTSPAGVCVTGYPVRIFTHDVVITHMRFRRGSHKGDAETEGESLYIGDAYNVIIDHCSISWGTDECLQVGSYWGDAYGVTISWTIVSEGLLDAHPKGNHAMGLLVSDKFYKTNPPEVTVHHSYLAHHYDRSPQLKGDILVDYRNNVMYDWYHQQGPRLLNGEIDSTLPRANIVSNYAKRGPNTNDNGCAGFFSSDGGGSGNQKIFVQNNRGCGRPTGSENEWAITQEWGSDFLSTSWQKGTAWNMAAEAQGDVISVTTTTMTEDYALEILETVGATAPVRDSVDARVVQEFKDGSGDILNDVSYPDDFPAFQNLPVPTDSDNDGMADSWENTTFGNFARTASGDEDGDGYTNIEEYIHSLSGNVSSGGILPDPELSGILPAPELKSIIIN